ncbi:hypothetical protein BASA81_011343 [Batrachochytrium salamandrivorans]|nr:hypothetical protein BASA81_011343 [Batrachochytrium salamandrivorans]
MESPESSKTPTELFAAAAADALAHFKQQIQQETVRLEKELNVHISQFPELLLKTVTLREFLDKYDGSVDRYLQSTARDTHKTPDRSTVLKSKTRLSLVVLKHVPPSRQSITSMSDDQMIPDDPKTNQTISSDETGDLSSVVPTTARKTRSKPSVISMAAAPKRETRRKAGQQPEIAPLDSSIFYKDPIASNAAEIALGAEKISADDDASKRQTSDRTTRTTRRTGRTESMVATLSQPQVPATPAISRTLPQTPSTRLRHPRRGEQLMSENGSPLMNGSEDAEKWRDSTSARRITLRSSRSTLSISHSAPAESIPPRTRSRAAPEKKNRKGASKSKKGSATVQDGLDQTDKNPLLVMKLGDGTVVDFDTAVSGADLQQQLGDSQRKEVADQIRNVQSKLTHLLGSMGINL